MRYGDGDIQLEVSEWTLPGPSVGDVTDEGVGASCQPPFVCEYKRRKEQSENLETKDTNRKQKVTKNRYSHPYFM